MTALQLTWHAAQQPCTRINYAGAAQVWRETAHKAQVAGDFEAMRQSHFRALEKEAMARNHCEPKPINTRKRSMVKWLVFHGQIQ